VPANRVLVHGLGTDEEGDRYFSPRRVWHADDRCLHHAGEGEQDRLDLGGRHVDARGLDHLRVPADEVETTVPAQQPRVPGLEPAVLGER
jgi:hypothetical protein